MLQLMISRDAGLLALDDEIRKFLPSFRIQSPYPPSRRGITLRQLATHLGGIPRESPCASFEECDQTVDEALAKIANLSIIVPPDTIPIYSNLGFDILGHTLATINNVSYEDLIDKTIINPLGLTDTGVNITRAPHAQLALPYLDDKLPCGLACLQDFGWSDPCGAMYSSVADIGKVMSLMFRDEAAYAPGTDQILDGASVRETLLPTFMFPDEDGFAMTWEMYKLGDYLVRTKRGDVNGACNSYDFNSYESASFGGT